MKTRGLFLLSAALVLMAFFAYGRTVRTYYELSATLYAMGGVEIEVKGYDTNPQTFRKAFEEIKERLTLLEDRMSRFKAGSDITRINELGSTAPVLVDPATFQILQIAARISKDSGGAFDVSILPVIQLWKQAGKENRFPAPERIAATRAKVSHQRIFLDQGTVRIAPGMGLDLGGIAQGWFADEGLAILRKHGIRRGLVNCSGEVAVYDDRSQPVPFSIAILDPRTGKADKHVALTQGAVATSGGYYRFVEIDGRKYSHILDPQTGRPAERTASVTIQGPSATEADAWSTACAVLAARGADPATVLPKGFRIWGLMLHSIPGNERKDSQETHHD